MLKIVSVPNKVLNTPVQPIHAIDNKIKQLVYNMEETLIAQVDPQGVGLAAPQVGISLSLFIIKPSPDADTEVFINPKILKIVDISELADHSKKQKTINNKLQTTNSDHKKLEGCLSIPRIWGPIKRAVKIKLQYQELNGSLYTKWFSGFKAVIIQHECDHLNGVLFTQRSIEQNAKLYEEKNGELELLRY